VSVEILLLEEAPETGPPTAVKAHDAEQARSAMLDHVALWARLNPDVSDFATGD
jgi:hypothetical protein